MFGKDLTENEQQSEDEDWGPHRRKRRTESTTGTIMVNCANEDGCSDTVSTKKISLDKKPLFRIPSNAVQVIKLSLLMKTLIYMHYSFLNIGFVNNLLLWYQPHRYHLLENSSCRI